jgi:Protein of unknown function (DUF1344)
MKMAIISAVSALALLSCSGLGSSADDTEHGRIDSIDKGDRLVTIDGDRYWVDEDVSLSDLHKGDNVTFTFQKHRHKDGYRIITDIDED